MIRETDFDGEALACEHVNVVRNGRVLLEDINLRIETGQHWALVGPNGSGKTTLMSLFAAIAHPTTGVTRVLGQQLGRVELAQLRRSIGFVQPRHPITSNMNALSVVMTGATATIETMMRWTASAHDVERAEQLIEVMGVAHVTDGSWQTLSQGERGRVLIARALMAQPRLLLLDEPSTGLDVAAREHLLARISALAGADESLTTVTITHHLEELPTSTTHAALIAGGRITAAGSAVSSLTTENVSTAFKYPIDVSYTRGRWSATSRS